MRKIRPAMKAHLALLRQALENNEPPPVWYDAPRFVSGSAGEWSIEASDGERRVFDSKDEAQEFYDEHSNMEAQL